MKSAAPNVLLSLLFFCSCAHADQLRRRLTYDQYNPHYYNPLSQTQHSRWLISPPDLSNTLLNSLISYFTPQIRSTLEKTLKESFDPLIITNTTSQTLGDVMKIGDCDTKATIEYGTEILKGLGSVHLDKIEMIPGENNTNITVSLLDGATWNSTWLLNASFTSLSAQANATLKIDACGVPAMQHELSGTAVVEQPSIYMELAVQGETSNLILFQSTSQVNDAQVLDLKFHYQMVDAQLQGNFGNMSFVNLGVELGEAMYHDASVFELMMKDALQTALEEKLPFKPNSA